MVYLNNLAAAYFGLKKFDECIATCKKAVEIGKEHRADFKDLARAYARMGNALVKLDDLEGALVQYENSLMEHRDPQVQLKQKDTQRLIDKRAAEAYLDPAKAEEQRLKGNDFFKQGKWVEAIKEYSEGLKRDPNNHLIYSNRGATYIKVEACIKVACVVVCCSAPHPPPSTHADRAALCAWATPPHPPPFPPPAPVFNSPFTPPLPARSPSLSPDVCI